MIPAGSATPGPSKVKVNRAAIYGVIDVQAGELDTRVYISEAVNHTGRLYLLRDIKQALPVRSIQSNQPHNFQVAAVCCVLPCFIFAVRHWLLRRLFLQYSAGGAVVSHSHTLLGVTRGMEEESSDLSEDE